MPRIAVNGIRLYYEEAGSGDAFLLLSGTAGGCGLWRRQVPVFAQHYRTVSFDYRGTGESDHPEEFYSTKLFAQDALGLMDALAIDRFHVIGHSMGVTVAQMIALEAPQRIRSLILASSGGFYDPAVKPVRGIPIKLVLELVEKGYEQRMRDHYSGPFWFPAEFRQEHPEIVQATVDEIIAGLPPLPFYLRHVLARQEHDVADRLGEIRCPTLILAGKEETIADGTMPILHACEHLVRRVSGARLVVFEGCAHGYFQQIPDLANRAVLEFLRGQSAG